MFGKIITTAIVLTAVSAVSSFAGYYATNVVIADILAKMDRGEELTDNEKELIYKLVKIGHMINDKKVKPEEKEA